MSDNSRTFNTSIADDDESEVSSSSEVFNITSRSVGGLPLLSLPRTNDILYVYDIDDMTLLSEKQFKKTMNLRSGPDLSFLSTRWQSVKKCLVFVDRDIRHHNFRLFENLVLCDDELDNAYAKTDFAGLAIHDWNMYSTANQSKEEVFATLRRTYGRNCDIVVITSNEDTIRVAEKLLLHIWPVRTDADFERLGEHQREHWMQKRHRPTARELEIDRVLQDIDNRRVQIHAITIETNVRILTNTLEEALQQYSDPDVIYSILDEKVWAETRSEPPTDN